MINERITAPLIGPPPNSASPVGAAYRFNGRSSRILSSYDPAYNVQANFEWAVLIKVDSGKPYDQVIFGKSNNTGPLLDGWRVMFNPSSQSFSFSVGDPGLPQEERCQSAHIDLDRWLVVRGNHDGGDARIVVNGVEVIDASFLLAVSAEPFLVGGTVGSRFYGSISKLTIWNRLLTNSERSIIDGVATNWPFKLG